MMAGVYAKSLRKADHTRTFSIRDVAPRGWEVVYAADDAVVKAVRYDDWHRVERAKKVFAREALMLRDAGWVES